MTIENSHPSSQENNLSNDELDRFFKYATESDLTKCFLVPFYHSLGYELVILKNHHEKRDEYGIDIAFKYRFPEGFYWYVAFVVKARKNIHASNRKSYSTLFSSVLNEASMALEHRFFDKNVGTKVRADCCYIINSGNITEQARSAFNEKLEREGKRITQFKDKDFFLEWNLTQGFSYKIVEKIKKFLGNC